MIRDNIVIVVSSTESTLYMCMFTLILRPLVSVYVRRVTRRNVGPSHRSKTKCEPVNKNVRSVKSSRGRAGAR